jgi:hypothetical protein
MTCYYSAFEYGREGRKSSIGYRSQIENEAVLLVLYFSDISRAYKCPRFVLGLYKSYNYALDSYGTV